MMDNLTLVETLEPGIVSLTLNRSHRRNALNIALLEQLNHEIQKIEGDRGNRVVILGGAGPVFSAGLDLKEASDVSLVERSAIAVERALYRLQRTSLIVIAAVHGGAYAGGAGLMAACDVVIAAEDAQFAFPEARRGLLPALICNVLRHKVGEGDLRDLFLVGDPIDAQRALRIGLVQRIVPVSQLRDAARELAKSVISGGPYTIRQTKELINEAFADAIQSSGTHMVKEHLAARHSEEAREGLAAFIEKREPKWD
ncbi:putative enoyl-CoA hydratase echA8 [Novipirellula galeiformis]|uniref:Putative enoyl-CoA hydratase echA8 n=1 Tax=Novipirellula galeiformis TaxID=2528004 RepID=A0A5C6CPQ8_9BACT|nr:enoyl-CoA hydratase/isomerase family protein [Novipirellula galeiformis]TWU25381.1 putative enoyl-CoA hydratase echA8 [Novipirellula galeiformis]